MPCYTVTTMELDASRFKEDVLKDAIKAEGFSVREFEGGFYGYKGVDCVRFSKGNLTITAEDTAQVSAAVKRAYARETIKRAARKYRMRVTEVSKNELRLRV